MKELMQTDLDTLKDLFKISYETFESSRLEDEQVRDMYHNRQYTEQQLAQLNRRGQPAETFNIIKLFARLLIGYYSTVVNTIKVQPVQESDMLTAFILNDIVQYTFENNHFETEGDKIKQDGILSGLMCVYENVIDTGRKDEYGRPINRIELSHVPSREVLLDPMSSKEDYSDARFVHRFKWVSEEYLYSILREEYKTEKKIDLIINQLNAYENYMNQEDTEFTASYGGEFIGYYKEYNNYLLIHTVIKDDKDKVWSIFWCGDTEISRKEITYKEVKFPYRIQKLHSSDKVEYYGIFREIIESQKAINQALLKIQLMANSQKVFVLDNSVEDIDKFADSVNRVNSIIEVKKLDGIKVVDLTRQVGEQYVIIDKAFDRIQRVLGVNDSFLGMAYASDSGRKVKLQQNATTLALRYVSTKIEQFYRLLGWDIVNLAKQFYTAHDVLRIADQVNGDRWVEVNRPMEMWTGQISENNTPIMQNVFEEVLDPENNTPMIDENGNYIIAPVPDIETEIAFSDVDLTIDTSAYNDEDEKNQLMLETVLQGNVGNVLLQYNPSAYLKAASLSVKSVKTKHSKDISKLLNDTAQQMQAQQMPVQSDEIPQKELSAQRRLSQELKLPQNTNEGI